MCDRHDFPLLITTLFFSLYTFLCLGQCGMLSLLQLYEVLLYLHIGKDWATYIHHIAVLVNYSRALTHGKMHFYGSWLGTVEGTNPFLSLTFAMMRCGFKPTSKALEYSTMGLLISFLFIRVLSLPVCFATIALDADFVRASLPVMAAAAPGSSSAAAVVGYLSRLLDHDWLWFQLGCCTMVFLWALSTWWFSKMVRGVLKRGKAKNAKEENQAKVE